MNARDVERFWSHVSPEPTSGCLLWDGATHSKGHGHWNLRGQHQSAHRVAWELRHGPIPEGLFVCHKCDVPSCVNVAHLFLGTNSDNMADMVAKRRHWLHGKDRCQNGHEYLPGRFIVYQRANGKKYRHCYDCDRLRRDEKRGGRPAPRCRCGAMAMGSRVSRKMAPDGLTHNRSPGACVPSVRKTKREVM